MSRNELPQRIRDNSANSFVMQVRLTVQPDKIADFTAKAAKIVSETQLEPGNIDYDLWQKVSDSNRFIFTEHWKDVASFQTHVQSAHFTKFNTATSDFVTVESVHWFIDADEDKPAT